jgi:hypothetical protein
MNEIRKIEVSDSGEYYIDLGEKVCNSLGWNVGDVVEWTDNKDGSFTLTKAVAEIEKELVLVECVSSYVMRYVVEVPKGKKEWALDTVSMHEAKEFSQRWLGETITSHRVIEHDEFINLCKQDNDYLSHWAPEKMEDSFITKYDAKKK